jgi:Ribbon-helix-helix protein, copG family
VRTTLTLDEDVAAKLKALMRQTGRSFKETVNEALRSGLAWRSRAKKQKPFKIHARDLGLRPGFNLDCTGRILQQLDELERSERE